MRSFIIIFFFLPLLSLKSQPEAWKWYFGYKSALDFSGGSPVTLTNSAMHAQINCGSVADAAGNLLFYTNGDTIWNRQHLPMANGTGLISNRFADETGIIVKQPDAANLYVIFTHSVPANNNYTISLYYSIVDMGLAAGNGSVTSKNVMLADTSSERMGTTMHCNGKDLWLINSKYASNEFWAFLVSAVGVSNMPVKSIVGPLAGSDSEIRVSPDGKWLISGMRALPNTYHDYWLYSFDNSTGVISNPQNLLTNLSWNCNGYEFSADSRKMYATGPGACIYQWDLCAGSAQAIAASVITVTAPVSPAFAAGSLGTLELGPDGKIYGAMSAASGFTPTTLAVIGNPTATGAAINYSLQGQGPVFPGGFSAGGLPLFPSGMIRSAPPLFLVTQSCSAVSFSAPVMPSCGVWARPIVSREWLFDDPGSGLANTSALLNATHQYSSGGNYKVKLVLHYACGNDTISQQIQLSGVPALSVTGTFTTCKGNTLTFTASGADTYTWNGTAGQNTMTVNAQGTTTFSLSGSNAASGCTSLRQFTLTVNPCLGIEVLSKETIHVYPNPFTDEVWIESPQAAGVILRNVAGQVVHESEISPIKDRIGLERLPPGFYDLEIHVQGESYHLKVIRQQ